jgi:hypothetical protein
MISREHLPGGDARYFESCRSEPLLDARHIDLGRIPQREFHAVVTEPCADIHATGEVVPEDDKRAWQRIRGGHGQTDFHRQPPAIARGRLTMRSVESPYFTMGFMSLS